MREKRGDGYEDGDEKEQKALDPELEMEIEMEVEVSRDEWKPDGHDDEVKVREVEKRMWIRSSITERRRMRSSGNWRCRESVGAGRLRKG